MLEQTEQDAHSGQPAGCAIADVSGKGISAALLMGAGVFILCRYAGLRIWHAAICIIFGFYLASSSLAPDIANITTSLFRLL